MVFPLCSLAQDVDFFDLAKKGKYSFEPLRVASSTINSVSNNMNLQADGYYFRFDTDSLSAYLPYVGVMTNTMAPNATTNAIIVDSKVKNYKIKEISKGKKLNITFEVYSKHSNENFNVMVTVTKSGSTDVLFRSGRRAFISFIGDIR